MSFLLLCSFQRAFCFVFFPNRFAVPRKVRPRSSLRVPRFSSSRLALRKKSFAKPVGKVTFFQTIPFGLRYPLKTNQCRTAFASRCLDFEICSEVSLASCLLRKEVIQPHLPIRLPCYDFTPVIAPALDGCLLAVGPPALGVNDFRGVTGGVYKARERIHRSMLTCDY